MTTQDLRSTFKGRIDIGVIHNVGDVFMVRPLYPVREFFVVIDGTEDFGNAVIKMQFTRDRVNMLDKSHVGKKVELWYHINGIIDKTGRVHNVLNCVNAVIL